MNTKLTLNIEQVVIDRAKKYARLKGRSLSDLVENYLKVISQEESTSEVAMSPMIKSLRGSFKAPADLDYKKDKNKTPGNIPATF